MKKQNAQKPSRSQFTILRQLCNFIPPHCVPQLARETNAQSKARSFQPWSHVVAMLYVQLAHSISLADTSDALHLHSGLLSAIRGATPPSKNALSHANKVRDPQLAEKLFWHLLAHLPAAYPGFGQGRRPKFAFRFKRLIHVVDSTTIELVAQCLDWARHRRRKAAAKCHLHLDLQSFLPRFALVGSAQEHDNTRARELCAGIQAGEIVVFDKAYLDFNHLADLHHRGVLWVTRAKDNLAYRVLKKRPQSDPLLEADEEIELLSPQSRAACPETLRRVAMWVEVDGDAKLLVFLTNQLDWSPHSVAALYRCRWSIEAFFKELKQSLQLVDFLGCSASAVKWQIWTALLVHLLLRFAAWLDHWGHSFLRLFALLRSALWQKLDLRDLLLCYGTARGGGKFAATPQQAFLPGIT